MQIPWRSVHPPVRGAVSSSSLPSATACLLAAQITAFIVQWGVREAVGGHDYLLNALGISAEALRAGRVWTPVTALFVEGGPGAGWLLAWGWLVFALAGRPLETVIGRRHLVQLYLLAGAVGGIAQVTAGEYLVHGSGLPVGEATAANGAVFFALACVLPRASLLPGMVRLRRVKIVHGAAALAGVFAVSAAAGPDPQALALGGLGGLLTGCLSMRALGFGKREQEAQPQFEVEVPPELVAAPVAAASGRLVVPRFTERERRMTPREYVAEQIDPILDKISRHGLDSLTPTERHVLDKGREKIAHGR